MIATITVYDLSRPNSDDEREPNPVNVSGVTPRQAVIAAHACSQGDSDVAAYEARYGHLVRDSGLTIACGDFSTWTNGREPTANETSAALANVERCLQ